MRGGTIVRRGLAGLIAAAALLWVPAGAQAQTSRTTARGTGGAAASVDTLATREAVRTLRAGGNAVDAAVVAAAVLGVVEPYSCGVGGGGFMVIRNGRTGAITTMNSRETAPAAMQPSSFFINGRAPATSGAEFDFNRYSGLSVGVPGTPYAWASALRRHGTLSLAAALAPAARIARKGFRVDQTFVSQTAPNVRWFDDIPASAELFLDPDGTPRDVGSALANPDLARLYERMGRLGVRRGFYRGPVADAIVAASTRPPVGPGADHAWRPGLMTLADLERYRVRYRDPARVRYRGYQVYGMGPPSSGGSTVGEALNILEGLVPLGTSRAEILHRYLEASRLAFADRNAFLADPSFFAVPLRGLLSDAFAAERRALIGTRAATGAVPAGDPAGEQAAGGGSATVTHPAQSTTHLTVADRQGNVVSYTFTIESTGGAGIVVPGYGFLLNNELTDFNIDSVTHPNRPEGRKRPRSSMSPTIIERGGRPFLAVGSPGGATIITTVLQILLNRLDFHMTLPDAIAAPRASQRNSARTEAERAFIDSPEGRLVASLYGHQLVTPAGGEIGAATAIELRRGNRFVAVAEPVRRGGGSARVVAPE
jgi:gamma-glutamyltranspeptidase/glutathione hydrolase